MSNIHLRTGDVIIYAQDFVPVIQEPFAEVRVQKSDSPVTSIRFVIDSHPRHKTTDVAVPSIVQTSVA
jgi:hypothetical protein